MLYDKRIGLDFETYSACDLKTHGLERYVSDPSFRVLIGSITMRDQEYGDYSSWTHDFVENFDYAIAELKQNMQGKTIVAHNSDFERRVLREIGIDLPAERFIDSAVVARAVGAGGHLNEAAPQLLGVDKMPDGLRLIKLFSIPGKLQEAGEHPWFDRQIVEDNPQDWALFKEYCELDSSLSLQIVVEYGHHMPPREFEFIGITSDMNMTGWPVDLEVVKEMQRRYEANVQARADWFRQMYAVTSDTFFNSLKQMKEWCRIRGVNCTSFDEKHVERYAERLDRKIDEANRQTVNVQKHNNYVAVRDLMRTKQILGGSSLKKLQTIIDTVGKDGRLRDQYFHIGAGQSWRTTGRGVQMQNLKRLAVPADMDTLFEELVTMTWDNEQLAENLRQVFRSEHPQGELVVGDFSSVESRGLAWLAGEEWKLQAFRDGLDVYKVGAAKQFGVTYDQVVPPQRQFGKVGELSCGYQAGSGAVKDFASKMGVEITEGEATTIVRDWRDANPQIVQLWNNLDLMLRRAIQDGYSTQDLWVGEQQRYLLNISHTRTPESLISQHPKGAQSLMLALWDVDGEIILKRFFHGVYMRGGDLCYYKPSSLKGGPKWSATYTNPKTKRVEHHKIYGGKMAGILTQSFCRELFFRCLVKVHRWCSVQPNVKLIGQFHDEIVLDWQPPGGPGQAAMPALDDTIGSLKGMMSDPGDVLGFPLEADVKHAHRYIK